MRSVIVFAMCGVLCAVPATALAQDAKKVRTLKCLCVYSLAFSPDGKTLASGGREQQVSLWEVPTGKKAATLKKKNSGDVELVAFSSDGKTLASWCDQQFVTLWNVTEAKEIKSSPGIDGEAPILRLTFAPDDKSLLAYAVDGASTRWDVPSGKPTGTMKGKIGFTAVERGWQVFTPDFKIIARRERDGLVRLYDISSGKEVAKMKNDDPQSNLGQLAFAPGSKLLAVAEGYESSNGFARIKLWEFAKAKVRILPGHKKTTPSALAFRPDGKVLASGCYDGSLKLWDVETGKELADMPAPGKDLRSDEITTLLFSPDGSTLAWGTRGNLLALWDLSDMLPKKKEVKR